MSSRLRIIVTGLIAQHPRLGGVAWDYLQYAVGLARLGHDVYYFEDSGEWPYNMDGGASGNDWVAHNPVENVRHLAQIMQRFGLGDKWAYRFPIEPKWFGLSTEQRKSVLKSADLLINVSGTLEHPENYRQIPRLVYIDSDPVFTQIKLNLPEHADFQKRVATHDLHFSFGERLDGKFNSGYRWQATRQPILLSEWRPSTQPRGVFTTVMSWTSYKPLTYRGEIYGQKDVEFRRFLGLPSHASSASFEVAVSPATHANWEDRNSYLPASAQEFVARHPQCTPHELLTHTGWRVIDPAKACCDVDSYRSYVETSRAEWSIQKNGYVRGQVGWFSCRSACYLAAARPVVVEDTGLSGVLPIGDGILTFRTLDEAVAAIREVESNYDRHSRSARALAEEFFDSDKVLNRVVEKATATHAGRNRAAA